MKRVSKEVKKGEGNKGGRKKGGWRQTLLAVKVQTVERMKLGASATELARELGVDRSLLYYWKYRLTHGGLRAAPDEESRPKSAEQREIEDLRAQVRQLQASLGQKTAELDFFAAALRQLEPIPTSADDNSASGSTSSSSSRRGRKAR